MRAIEESKQASVRSLKRARVGLGVAVVLYGIGIVGLVLVSVWGFRLFGF